MSVVATEDLTDQIVFDYWQHKADEEGDSPSATIRDLHYRELEIDTILRYLRPSDRVLDVGCGNGFATLRFARQVDAIVGVDYAPNMIRAAQRARRQAGGSVAARTTLQVGDARKLDFPDASFTRVVAERCLINIPDRYEQIRAAREFARLLEPGGLLLLAEVTLQGHERVNQYRTLFGLDNLKVHWHNTYLDEPAFLGAIEDVFEVLETIRFGMYGFVSKVLHPLLVEPDEPRFDARINEIAARIAQKVPDFDGCNHQVLFVLQKR